MIKENNLLYSPERKIELLENFIQQHPQSEVQDLYKWLYFGEFGPDENNIKDPQEKQRVELQKILDDLELECMLEPDDRIWDPAGMSGRFIFVYLSAYEKQLCPLNRIINLQNRSAAFVGSRMQFKLDWNLLKEHVIQMDNPINRQDFKNFEDGIEFYQMPELPFTEKFNNNYPLKYRIVPASLFFEYFPEFMDEEQVSYINDRYHLFD